MSDAKLFTVAGTSIHKGVQTYRFANSMNRAAVLRANGHTDVKLVQLPGAMTKADAIAYITTGSTVFSPVAAVAFLDASTLSKPAKAVKRVAEPKLSDEYNGSIEAAKYVDLWFARAASRLAAKKIKEMA